MALVRKTDKLEEAIVEKLQDAKVAKAEAVFKAMNIEKLMGNFLITGFKCGLIVPEADKEWATGQTQATYKDYVGFAPVKMGLGVRVPGAKDNQVGYIKILEEFYPGGPVFPCFKTPRMTYTTGNKEVVCGFSSPEDYNSVKGFNHFNLCFTINNMKRMGQNGKAGPIEYAPIFRPTELSNMGHYQFVLDQKQFERATSIAILSDNQLDIPSQIIEKFLMFQSIHEQITSGITRIEKSQQYIFSELWKLPSVNKMREFFPAITAFLPDETINKLNEGASARKKEYNISLPDSDVIVSATEASIKS